MNHNENNSFDSLNFSKYSNTSEKISTIDEGKHFPIVQLVDDNFLHEINIRKHILIPTTANKIRCKTTLSIPKSLKSYLRQQAKMDSSICSKPVNPNLKSVFSDEESQMVMSVILENSMISPTNFVGPDFASFLVTLDLKKCNLYTLPNVIFGLKKLRMLKLDFNNIKLIPEKISELEQLRSLTISNNLLVQFPLLSQKLRGRIETLDLSYNFIVNIPEILQEFASIRSFNLSHNVFKDLPNVFQDLPQLNLFFCDWFSFCPKGKPEFIEKSTQEFKKFIELSKKNKNLQKRIDFFSVYNCLCNGSFAFGPIDQSNSNILHYAAADDCIGILRALLPTQENFLNAVNNQRKTPLLSALEENKILSAKLLLAHGSDPRIGITQFGDCLHLAVQILEVDLINDIIKNKANVNTLNSERNSPLHFIMATFDDDPEKSAQVADILLNNKANPNLKNKDGFSPVIAAIICGQLGSIRYAKEFNKKKKVTEPKFNFYTKVRNIKDTIFHVALKRRNSEILTELEEYINNPFYENSAGHVAMTVSKKLRPATKEWSEWYTQIKLGFKIEKRYIRKIVNDKLQKNKYADVIQNKVYSRFSEVNNIQKICAPQQIVHYPVFNLAVADEYEEYDNYDDIEAFNSISSECHILYDENDIEEDPSNEKWGKKKLKAASFINEKKHIGFLPIRNLKSLNEENVYDTGVAAYQNGNMRQFKILLDSLIECILDENIVAHLRIKTLFDFQNLAIKILSSLCKQYRLKPLQNESFSFLLRTTNSKDISLNMLKMVSKSLGDVWDALQKIKWKYVSNLLYTSFVQYLLISKLGGILPYKDIKIINRKQSSELISLRMSKMNSQYNGRPDFHSSFRKLETPIGPRNPDTGVVGHSKSSIAGNKIEAKLKAMPEIHASKNLFSCKSLQKFDPLI